MCVLFSSVLVAYHRCNSHVTSGGAWLVTALSAVQSVTRILMVVRLLQYDFVRNDLLVLYIYLKEKCWYNW